MNSRLYCIITPCRNEAAFARRTLDSVTGQFEPPTLWVIVDDGSTDETPEILAEYASRFPYIRVIHRPDRGDRKLGGGVIDAFYDGLDTVDLAGFEFLCKLDLDLHLPPRYFSILMDRMESEPRRGSFSGKPYFFAPGCPTEPVRFPLVAGPDLISEKIGDENSVGASKFYRVACFSQIGGFVRELMWDGIDGHRSRQLGWIAASSDEPDLRFVHLRPMGSSHRSWWSGRVRHGFGQYFMGTTPVYMLASAVYRMSRPPLIVGGLAMLVGYFGSMFRRRPRYGNAEFRRFLRRYQWACLLRGKARATAALEIRQAREWEPLRPPAGSAGPGPHLDVA